MDFKLVQKATFVPSEWVQGYSVEVWDGLGVILVSLPDEVWVRIDLTDNTFAVGVSEG